MKTRNVLATQLRALMAKHPSLDTQQKVAEAAQITQSTVWRVLKAEVGASVDVVDSLARAFSVDPIAMLADPGDAPFIQLWGQMNAEDRYRVLSFMEVTIRSRPSNMGSTVQDWTNPQDTGPATKRASAKAGARPIRDAINTNDTQEKPTPERRKQHRHTA
jgi:hypothetical protein